MKYTTALLFAAVLAACFAGFTGVFFEPEPGEPPATLEYRLLLSSIVFFMVVIPSAIGFLVLAFILNALGGSLNGSTGGRSRGYDRLVAWIEKKYGAMPTAQTSYDLDAFMQNVVRKEKDRHDDEKIKGLKAYVDQKKYVGLLKK